MLLGEEVWVGTTVDVAGGVDVGWSVIVGSGVGELGMVAVAVGRNVDKGTNPESLTWVVGVSSWVQPSRMRMRRAAIVQSIICGLIRWSCLICFSKLCGDLTNRATGGRCGGLRPDVTLFGRFRVQSAGGS